MKLAGIKIELDIIPNPDGNGVTFNFNGVQVFVDDEGKSAETKPIPARETVFHIAEFLKSLAIEKVVEMEGGPNLVIMP